MEARMWTQVDVAMIPSIDRARVWASISSYLYPPFPLLLASRITVDDFRTWTVLRNPSSAPSPLTDIMAGIRRSKRLAPAVVASLSLVPAHQDSALLKLPAEMLESVLEAVNAIAPEQERRATLGALALTCRSVRHLVQSRLLSRIYIRTSSRLEEVAQYAKQLHTSGKTVIRALVLSLSRSREYSKTDWITFAHVAHLLLFLPRLESMWFRSDWTHNELPSKAFGTAMNKLTCLRELVLAVHSDILYSFLTRHVQHLTSLTAVTWLYDHYPHPREITTIAQAPLPFMYLTHLSIPATAFVQWPWGMYTYPSLRFAHVFNTYCTQYATAGKVKAISIRALTITLDDPEWDDALDRAAPPSLEVLILENLIMDHPSNRYPSVKGSLLLNDVTTCACSLKASYSPPYGPQWSRYVDDYLAEIGTAPKLKRFILFGVPPNRLQGLTFKALRLPGHVEFVVSALDSIDAEALLDRDQLLPRSRASWE